MKFTITETREIEVTVNPCICGHSPDIKTNSSGYSEGSAIIQCRCGLKMSALTSSLLIDSSSPTLLSLAQKCAHNWNRVMVLK